MTNPTMTQPPRKKRGRWWLVLAVLLAGVAMYAFVFLAWHLSVGRPGHADFYLHRSRYESIVRSVKQMPLAIGAQTTTHVDGLLVNVARSQSGSYVVTITTIDWHHAGVYGYVFSDVSLTPHPNANYPDLPSVDNPGDMPFSDKSIVGQGGHWWSVYNDLM
jgi:hypothetical protein